MDDHLPVIKIRSITCFVNPGWPLDPVRLDAAGNFARVARNAFMAAGYEVQTLRLATIPFSKLIQPGLSSRRVNLQDDVVDLARRIEVGALERGFEYVSLGPASPKRLKDYDFIPAVIAATRNVFISASMTIRRGGVSLPAVQACGRIIQQNSEISPDGFANLRFAALANMPAGSPFFPAAYHHQDHPAFALALESAGMVVQVFQQAGSLEDARKNLTDAIQEHGRRLGRVARQLEETHAIRFGGIDFSPAPYPTPPVSLGAALESLGLAAIGQPGSLAAAAFLANTIDRADFPRTGFSGLMLPVLEDSSLALRAAQGSLTVRDLLLYSAVCGTGLDTVPLPGAITPGELSAILLDVAALSQRLRKPLTARLMPVPGKAAGDPTQFDFSFFVNSRVMAPGTMPLEGLLAGGETFYLHRRSAA